MKKNIFFATSKFLLILIVFIFFSNNQILANEELFYKWKDENGVIHVTDNPNNIPLKHRDKIIKYEKKQASTKSRINNYLKKTLKIIVAYKYYLLGVALIIFVYFLIKRILNRIKIYSLKRKSNSSENLIKKSGINEMSEDEFKTTVKKVLINSGYKLEDIDAPFITTTNLIGEKKGKKYAVYISTNINQISKNQINEVEIEKQKYGCVSSIIISRSGFDCSAYNFAKRKNCKLIDLISIAKAMVKKTTI